MQRVKSYKYGEDIAENSVVKFSDEGVVVKCKSPLDKPCGVALFAGKQGAMGDVVRAGEVLVNTSGAVTAGDFLMTDEEAKACSFILDATAFKNATATALIGYTIGQIEESATIDAKLWMQVNIAPVKIK